MKKVVHDEKVLCLRRSVLKRGGLFQGLSMQVERYTRLLANEENLFFLPRSEAERDFRFKQWIPYVLITKGNEILRYRRGDGGGESRLHGMLSIGFGGHVTERDCDEHGGYMAGLLREVREETGLQTAPTSAVAAINDDSTEVGRVHFGIVHIMRLPDDAKVSRRSEISSPEFVSLAKSPKNLDAYESWSRLCLESKIIEKRCNLSAPLVCDVSI